MNHKRTGPTLIAALVAVLCISGATTAEAAVATVQVNHNGICEDNELCLYYNSQYQGSMVDFQYNVPDFAGYTFLSRGAGRGEPVKNNAASAKNMKTNLYAHIHYNKNWQGPKGVLGPREGWEQLVNTYNENASLVWRSTP